MYNTVIIYSTHTQCVYNIYIYVYIYIQIYSIQYMFMLVLGVQLASLPNVLSVLASQALPQLEASCVRRQERPVAVANAKAAEQKQRRVHETVLGFD